MSEGFRDARGVATIARILLYANAAIAAVGAGLLYTGTNGKSGGVATFWIVQSVAMLVGAIVFLVWLYRAVGNARALGATDMMVTPGWAIGWYFVPLANLFMPYATMRELWKASARPRDWQLADAPVTIILWWIFWVLSNVAGFAAFRIDMEFGDAGGMVSLASNAFTCLAAPLLAHLIAGIEALQAQAKGTAASALLPS